MTHRRSVSMRERLPEPLPSAWRTPLVALLWMVIGASAAGCENKAIGRPCDLAGVDGGEKLTTVNPQALECPTRICVYPARMRETDTGPLCSAECTNDGDCEDAEGRDQSKGNDRRCTSGFTCAVATEVGQFCCKRICLCKDFLLIPDGGIPAPKSCEPGTPNSACRK